MVGCFGLAICARAHAVRPAGMRRHTREAEAVKPSLTLRRQRGGRGAPRTWQRLHSSRQPKFLLRQLASGHSQSSCLPVRSGPPAPPTNMLPAAAALPMSSFFTARLISTWRRPGRPRALRCAAPPSTLRCAALPRCKHRAAAAGRHLLPVEHVRHDQALLHGHLVPEGDKAKAARAAVRLPQHLRAARPVSAHGRARARRCRPAASGTRRAGPQAGARTTESSISPYCRK